MRSQEVVGLAAHGPGGPVADRLAELVRGVGGLVATSELQHVPHHGDGMHGLVTLGRPGVDRDDLPGRVGGGLGAELVVRVEHDLHELRRELGGADGHDVDEGILALTSRLEGRLELRVLGQFDHAGEETLGGDGHQAHTRLVARGGIPEVLREHVEELVLGTREVREARVSGLAADEAVESEAGFVGLGHGQIS
jgi:hypothetical protein